MVGTFRRDVRVGTRLDAGGGGTIALVMLSRASHPFLVWQVTIYTFCPGRG